MSRFPRSLGGFLAALILAALPAAAGSVSGVVRNGTTGRPAGGVDVILIQLQGGMQTVATTKTDAQGRYRLENASLGSQPMLLRAVYRGVNYHQPVPPGQPGAAVDIDVFEPTTDPSAFHVLHRIIAVEPQGQSLLIGEEFDVQNQSKPPKAYYKADGCFEFRVPAGAELNQVEAWGPSGMPVVQGTVNKGNGTYAIVFPFRPGQNGVRLSYHLDYAANKATVSLPSLYPAETAMLLAPPAVQVSADGFSASGNEHGWNVFLRQGMVAGAATVISVSGNGPPPEQGQDQAASPGGQRSGAEAGGDSGVTQVAQALPPRLDSLKWILVGGFSSLFILGSLFLWWRSRTSLVTTAGSGAEASLPTRGPFIDHAASQSASSARASSPAPMPEPAAGSGPDLRRSVDEIKELLFRLELRRQAGTLPEEEYQEQRKRAESALRDIVRG